MSPPVSSSITDAMRARLRARQTQSTLRTLTVSPRSSSDFSSNDFLSLSTSQALHQEYLGTLSSLATSCPSFRLGSTGSRLLDGNSVYAESLERAIAAFHRAPAALLFNSGFDANSGFFACVPQPGDVVLYDEYIHASVHEGMRLSRATMKTAFAHNSVEDLRRVLLEVKARDEMVKESKKSVFVALESLYSMDGDLAPIRDIIELVEGVLPAGNGLVVVDEAHSTGVYGGHGRGVVCELGLEDRIFARLHTFGKALACNGGSKLFPYSCFMRSM
jgi:8-amino-7-oxononanoate synthase